MNDHEFLTRVLNREKAALGNTKEWELRRSTSYNMSIGSKTYNVSNSTQYSDPGMALIDGLRDKWKSFDTVEKFVEDGLRPAAVKMGFAGDSEGQAAIIRVLKDLRKHQDDNTLGEELLQDILLKTHVEFQKTVIPYIYSKRCDSVEVWYRGEKLGIVESSHAYLVGGEYSFKLEGASQSKRIGGRETDLRF